MLAGPPADAPHGPLLLDELPDVVADRIRRALPHVPAERLIVAPDCGMKYLTREIAFAKLSAMVLGAGLVRAELQSSVAARA